MKRRIACSLVLGGALTLLAAGGQSVTGSRADAPSADKSDDSRAPQRGSRGGTPGKPAPSHEESPPPKAPAESRDDADERNLYKDELDEDADGDTPSSSASPGSGVDEGDELSDDPYTDDAVDEE